MLIRTLSNVFTRSLNISSPSRIFTAQCCSNFILAGTSSASITDQKRFVTRDSRENLKSNEENKNVKKPQPWQEIVYKPNVKIRVYLNLVEDQSGKSIQFGEIHRRTKVGSDIFLSIPAAKILHRELAILWDWILENVPRRGIASGPDNYFYPRITEPEGVIYERKFVDNLNLLYTLELLGWKPGIHQRKKLLRLTKWDTYEGKQIKVRTLNIPHEIVGKTSARLGKVIRQVDPEWELPKEKRDLSKKTAAQMEIIEKRRAKLKNYKKRMRNQLKQLKKSRAFPRAPKRIKKPYKDLTPYEKELHQTYYQLVEKGFKGVKDKLRYAAENPQSEGLGQDGSKSNPI